MQNNEKKAILWQLCISLNEFLCMFFWILIIYGFDSPCTATLTVACAAAHELGHVCVSGAIGRNKIPQSRINGFRISDGGISYKERIILCLSGPFVNIILGCASVLLFPFSTYATAFGALNLLTALSNLLPIRGSDGYNAIQSFIFHNSETGRGALALEWTSFALTCLSAVFSLYLLLRIGEGHWMCGLLLLSLIKELESIRKRRFLRF